MSVNLAKYKNLNKHFEDFKEIGSGGFGIVYSATYKKNGKRYAIKLLTCNDLTKKETTKMRFRNEVNLLKKVKSENVVRMFGSFISEEESYLAMELIEGTSLKNLLKKKGKMNPDETVIIAKEICQGLIDIHKNDIVHRDLKPNNILINNQRIVKLIDFGISLSDESLRLTAQNKLVGSVQYVAPELVTKSSNPSVQSDIYAFGIILYEMLSGKLPYSGTDHQAIALMHVNNEFPPLEGAGKTIPQALENIIIKCTAKNIADRYSTCTELYRDLVTCLSIKRVDEPKLILGKPKKNVVEKVNSKAFTISLIIIGILLIAIAIILGVLYVGGKL
ncbi:serine/threonine-protein kinase [Metamycoplasma buccale]|uniref:serine/threonine-protein kinase n=1 Tax=Metamycoplasma buccale TaxID=55602 RepID=UPI00398E554B